jgi:hypothetical protein
VGHTGDSVGFALDILVLSDSVGVSVKNQDAEMFCRLVKITNALGSVKQAPAELRRTDKADVEPHYVSPATLRGEAPMLNKGLIRLP